MTKNQIEAIHWLSAQPQWQAFMEYKRSRLDSVHDDLEFSSLETKTLQGQAAEIRNDLSLSKDINQLINNKVN